MLKGFTFVVRLFSNLVPLRGQKSSLKKRPYGVRDIVQLKTSQLNLPGKPYILVLLLIECHV